MIYVIPKIKFSHEYFKLDGAEKAILFSIKKVDNLKELPIGFLNYDTKYWNPKKRKSENYPLNMQIPHLILFFYAKEPDPEVAGHVFTTIRRWTPEKERYYNSLIYHEFDLVMEEERP